MTAGLLVSTDWLGERLDRAGRDFVLVDAGDASAYRRVHLPGAMGLPHPYLKARNDDTHLMGPAEFETLARSLGISNDTPVIVYDDNASLHAARAWWVFEHFGHRDVRVVNGGFNAWLDEGRPLTSVIPRPTPGSFVARVDAFAACDLDQVRAAASTHACTRPGSIPRQKRSRTASTAFGRRLPRLSSGSWGTSACASMTALWPNGRVARTHRWNGA